VHHLKECFGLFTPDGDSTLLTEVAARTAEVFNECGFDMMYLDALDGEDILGGAENGWHYGSKFVFELWRHLKRPVLMEMSTFHHHLWFVRSRMGAWDHPTRNHKRFIDIHCTANEDYRRMFLPVHLGWWAILPWVGAQWEPTFPDDIEYLLCKCLGTGTGLSLQKINPDNIATVQALPRLAGIIKRYEDLRHSGIVPESIKARLRVPGDEFTLFQDLEGGWQFRPVEYAKHNVEGMNGWSNVWQVRNRFDRQPLKLRIEALMSVESYDTYEGMTLADFSADGDFSDRAAASGVTAELQTRGWPVNGEEDRGIEEHGNRETRRQEDTGIGKQRDKKIRAEPVSGCYTVLSSRSDPASAWTMVRKTFSPPLELRQQQALGVWIYGDGQGEILNFQVRSPEHISTAIGEHYVTIDFLGWRYVELVEPEGERYAHYAWPYGDSYSIYRESVDYGHIASLNLWYNNLPQNRRVTCYLSPIRALPLITVTLKNPTVRIGDRTIVFPIEIESGCYLEFRSMSDCRLYGRQGERLCEVLPQGAIPILVEGENQVTLMCDVPAGVSARACLTVISEGKALRE
jgi:hypothetical protein